MSIGEKLREVDNLFRMGSKSHSAAVEVVTANRELSKTEKQALCAKLGISLKTLGYVLTKLRKAGLYGPNAIAEVLSKHKEELENLKEVEAEPKIETEVNKEPREERPPSTTSEQVQEFVTRKEFEQLVSEIRALSSVLMGQTQEPAYTAFQEAPQYNEAMENNNPEDTVEPLAEEAELTDVSMKQMGTWVKAKNLLFFDLAREGAFGGVLADFNGNWSDFVNLVIEDYFRRMGVGVGLLSRRFV